MVTLLLYFNGGFDLPGISTEQLNNLIIGVDKCLQMLDTISSFAAKTERQTKPALAAPEDSASTVLNEVILNEEYNPSTNSAKSALRSATALLKDDSNE